MTVDPALAGEQYCYLTTTGRSSGQPRTIEIWFCLVDSTLYMLSGGRDRSHWVKNLRRDSTVTVRFGETEHRGLARLVSEPEEDALARRLLLAKYAPGYERDLTEWGRTALPVAVEFDAPAEA